MQKNNRLSLAASPYLLQHSNNPVDWYEWGDEAWSRAKTESKLVLVSVGYSACHWCHVMAHECFENEETATLMNNFFINIKVDREERPDIDSVMMDACQLVTQRGGWPLNVFCLPDGRPIHAGTYFPKIHWDDLLFQLAEFYKKRKNEAEEYAEKLKIGINNLEKIYFKKNEKYNEINLESIAEKFKQQFDETFGGYNHFPKFMMPVDLNFFLHYVFQTDDEIIKNHLLNTLKKMSLGGIFDQVGGGFARYSTDIFWKVPHFEKMLYDNAQLMKLYSESYMFFGKEYMLETAEKIAIYMQREMLSPQGLFYSALDADSEGTEGKFYAFTKNEIEKILGNDVEIFCKFFTITEEGNFEHGQNILHKISDEIEFCTLNNINESEFREKISVCLDKIFLYRETRIRPGLDDKIIFSWNALAISGFCALYIATENEKYLKIAEKCYDAVCALMVDKNNFFRIYRNGKRSVAAFSEDYIFFANACFHLYEATFNEKYLLHTKQICDDFIAKFYNAETGFFYFTSNEHEQLAANKHDITDDVIPSANSTAAILLYQLGFLFDEEKYVTISEKMLQHVSPVFEKYVNGYSNWFNLALLKKFELKQFVIASKKFPAEIKKQLQKKYSGYSIFAWSNGESSIPLLKEKIPASENKILIFPCSNKVCGLPEKIN